MQLETIKRGTEELVTTMKGSSRTGSHVWSNGGQVFNHPVNVRVNGSARVHGRANWISSATSSCMWAS
ncbi:hypothetical protein SLEP1_g22418 [Rubroshorea leprosula]|uniref:Uncharacterized protein n=1 Tax=Rubroshorea leprosula TaxID=152421 RepID=A0AAV5JEG6_9ROSI|nr:hypothetical protein SLEP1_g22418 [Rubroshorea leprosula]